MHTHGGETPVDFQEEGTAMQPQTYLGVDVGGTRIKWALTTDGGPGQRGDLATARAGGQALVAQIAELVNTVGAAVTAVGLAMPGLVDTLKRETLFIPNIPGTWSANPLGAQLEALTGKPLLLLNDARAFGHAELHAG